MEKLNLRELKGAPLSIILAIVMAGNRSVSVSWLVTETGYSDKTVNSGLDLLRSRQIITQTGRCRYQLTGENVQLPLYWGEKVEPVNPSPASDQPALFDFGGGGENFSGENFSSGQWSVASGQKSGNFPESGKIPELEKRVSELEKRVTMLEKRNFSGIQGSESGNSPEISGQWSVVSVQESGNSPESGEIPGESGDFPDLINLNKENNTDPDMDVSCLILSETEKSETGKIPDLVLDNYEKFRKNCWSTNQSLFNYVFDGSGLIGYEDGIYTIGLDTIDKTRILRRQDFDRNVIDYFSKVDSNFKDAVYTVLSDEEKALIREREAEKLRLKKEQLEKERLQAEQRRQEEWLQTHLSCSENPNQLEKVDVDICNEYLDKGTGVKFSVDELREIVALKPRPAVLDFVLPRAASFEALKKWAVLDLYHLKYELMTKYCIVRYPKLDKFAKEERFSPALIDYHYWNWYLYDRNEHPEHDEGWYVWLIDQQAKKMVAENEGPLVCGYLE